MGLRVIERVNIQNAMLTSLLIHGIVAIPFLLTGMHVVNVNRSASLQVELYGMTANRQIAQQVEGTANTGRSMKSVSFPQKKLEPPTPQLHPEAKIESQKPPEKLLLAGEGQVKVKSDNSEESQKPPASAGAAPQSVARAGSEAAQRQQGAGAQSVSNESRIQEYVAWVARQVNAHLVYPKSMRRLGVEGVCQVEFTVTPTGEIQRNSLRIQRSSGYDLFDANALKVVVTSAPFKRPPQELTLTIDIAFDARRL